MFLRRGVPAIVSGLILAAIAGGLIWWQATATPSQGLAAAASTASLSPAPVSAAPPAETTRTVTIPTRSTIVTACAPFQVPASLVQTWIRTAKPVFNLAHIRAGHELTLVSSNSGQPLEFSYQIAPNRYLRLKPDASGTTGAWTAAIETIPYETRLAGVSGTVQSSLFGAVENAGETDELAVDLANIFGWDLDFYTDPRQGDVFRVLVEKHYLNGKFSGYGQVVAAEYVNDGQPFDALRYHDDLGLLAYYRPDGKPMKREFLRSPLKFAARITSGFSRSRYHPILKIYRPHLGTDFAAPIGTPVQTIGNGEVVRAGRFGGDGNMVQIRHTGGYQTLYLHLSRILVRVGQRVAQGQTIGLVGMTGLATGPHLDFRIEQGGSFENFEALRRKLPPAAPVSRGQMAAFLQLKAEYMPQLEALHPATAATSDR